MEQAACSTVGRIVHAPGSGLFAALVQIGVDGERLSTISEYSVILSTTYLWDSSGTNRHESARILATTWESFGDKEIVSHPQ